MSDRIPDVPDSRTPSERLGGIGRTPAESAALDRIAAGLVDLAVARCALGLAAHQMSGAFKNFINAWEAAERRWSEEAAEEIATHPDLVEVNVVLDGWYA